MILRNQDWEFSPAVAARLYRACFTIHKLATWRDKVARLRRVQQRQQSNMECSPS